jgi:hypothetical protein
MLKGRNGSDRALLYHKMLLHFHVRSHFSQVGRSNISPDIFTNAGMWLYFIQTSPKKFQSLLHKFQDERHGTCPNKRIAAENKRRRA